MRTTEQILIELQATKTQAELNLDTVGAHVRGGHEMAKRDAADRLPRLFREYIETLFKGARALFANGSPEKVDQYVKLAQAEGGVVVVDGSELYERLANEIEPSLGSSRNFGVTQLMLLVALVKGIANEIEFKNAVPPTLNELRACSTHEDLVAYIRERVESVMGNNLLVAFTQFKVADAACAAGFDGKVLPVVVTGTNSADRASLTPLFVASISFDLDAAEAIDTKFVISTFRSVTSGSKAKPTQSAPKPTSKPSNKPDGDVNQTEPTTQTNGATQ